jgi:hypothetical protein
MCLDTRYPGQGGRENQILRLHLILPTTRSRDFACSGPTPEVDGTSDTLKQFRASSC